MKNITESISNEDFDKLFQKPSVKEGVFEGTRLAAIKERKNLFETKFIKIISEKEKVGAIDNEEGKKEILFCMRDPGNTNNTIPLIKELVSDHKVECLTDGLGMDAVQKNFLTEELTSEVSNEKEEKIQTIFGATKLHPDMVVLTNTRSEPGLEHFVIFNFPHIPTVFVEEMSGAAVDFLNRLKERYSERSIEFSDFLSRLKKVCVLDEISKDFILKEYPELDERVVITGQPIYDRICKESDEKRLEIKKDVRNQLNVNENEVLVSFFGGVSGDSLQLTPNTRDCVELIVSSLSKLNNPKIRFMFGRHPRDPVALEEYKKILGALRGKEISLEQVGKLDADKRRMASDVVISLPLSTILYDCIFSRIPNIALVDRTTDGGIIIPAIVTGASIEINDMNKFSDMLLQLLDSNSDLNRETRKNQEKFFVADGKSAKRVAAQIKEVL